MELIIKRRTVGEITINTEVAIALLTNKNFDSEILVGEAAGLAKYSLRIIIDKSILDCVLASKFR